MWRISTFVVSLFRNMFQITLRCIMWLEFVSHMPNGTIGTRYSAFIVIVAIFITLRLLQLLFLLLLSLCLYHICRIISARSRHFLVRFSLSHSLPLSLCCTLSVHYFYLQVYLHHRNVHRTSTKT